MQFITKKHVSRREVLRGIGAALSLPLLDAMAPAATAFAATAAAPKTRLCCIEMVHGAAGSTGEGGNKHYWSPAQTGRDFEWTQSLEPLKDFRDYLTIVSDTDLHPATAWSPSEEGADHFRSSAVYLTAAHPKMTEGSDYLVGTSLDQLYAQQFGQDTPLPSIQLCIEMVDASGACDYGYACVYADTISWASPTAPLPMTLDPRMVFENLFGEGGTPEERKKRQAVNKSILDWISHDVARLQKDLGPSDRRRLGQYLDNVREIERRIERLRNLEPDRDATARQCQNHRLPVLKMRQLASEAATRIGAIRELHIPVSSKFGARRSPGGDDPQGRGQERQYGHREGHPSGRDRGQHRYPNG